MAGSSSRRTVYSGDGLRRGRVAAGRTDTSGTGTPLNARKRTIGGRQLLQGPIGPETQKTPTRSRMDRISVIKFYTLLKLPISQSAVKVN